MAALFGRAKKAFADWNKADASGLSGMQRLGNLGAHMQGQGPMFQPQPQPQGQPQGQGSGQGQTAPTQPGLVDRLGAFGSQMQDIGGEAPPPPPVMQPMHINMPGLPSLQQAQQIDLARFYGRRR